MAGTAAAMLLGGHAAGLGGSASAQQEAGLEAVNAARAAAGLTPLRVNPLLNRAAADHAHYLLRNKASGHEQKAGRPGYTGHLPLERAHHAGYRAAGVSENLALGVPTVAEAVDNLMSAIYHRFGFLAVDIDELGIGTAPGDPKESPFVFNMSDSGMTALCVNPPPSARFDPPGVYTQLCGPDSPKLKAGAVEAQQARLLLANPAWVLWPPPGYDRTPPAFFDEVPDPLPDRSVSGYPISIQFNRGKVKSARLRGFRLTEGTAGGTREVTPLRLLNQKTDPNHEFSALDFAWFPLQRLDWNSAYRVAADFEVDGKPQHLEWEFNTRNLGMPVITLTGAEPVLRLPAGVEHAVYVPPTDKTPRLASLGWESAATMKIATDGIDPNTLRVRITGPPCSVGLLKLSGGRKVKLQVAPADNAATDACVLKAPEFTIAGKGERLVLNAGAGYRIQVKAGSGASGIGKIGWGFPDTMKVKVEIEPPDVARIEIEGRPCDTAQFTLSGGRTFEAAVAGPKCPATPPGQKR